MHIFDKSNIKELKNISPIAVTQLYLYVIENSSGNIKIGKTTNIVERVKSLSGSNGGSFKITRIAVSEPTYVLTMETIMHNHFNYCRINGTEWFDGNKVSWQEIVDFVDYVFSSDDYKRNNEYRQFRLNQNKDKGNNV